MQPYVKQNHGALISFLMLLVLDSASALLQGALKVLLQVFSIFLMKVLFLTGQVDAQTFMICNMKYYHLVILLKAVILNA